ncbi:hypothetical protein [Bacteroides cellulosilyticus]|uniref:hypothetical protein n=1 Tax=Bacteroides cellulosilyticus TaxID=246787 RepID=UPI003566051A
MMDNKYEMPTPDNKENVIVLSRNKEGQFVLLHTTTGERMQTDERTASKLMLWNSLGETAKSNRLASQVMGCTAGGFRLDTVLQNENDARRTEGKGKGTERLTDGLNLDEERGRNNPEKSEKGVKTGQGVKGENEQQAAEREGKNTVLDAHVTGIGAAGDFHMAARLKNEVTGEVRDVKGMITGLDAALLRSNTNEQGKDGTVLRNAQALASENFEKGMSVAFPRNNSFTMKME